MTVLYPKRKTVDQVGESKNLTRIVETSIRELTETMSRLHVTERLRIPEGADKYDSGSNYKLVATATESSGGVFTGGDAVWADCHDAVSGDDVYTGYGLIGPGGTQSTVQPGTAYLISEGGYGCYRAFLYFDTSPIGSEATILNATLTFYCQRKYEDDVGHSNVYLVEGIQDEPLAADDYGDHLAKTASGGSIVYAAVQTSQSNDIILNSTGRGWINKTGTTKLCIRIKGDIDDTAPAVDGNNNFVELRLDPTEEQNGGVYLTINYTNNQSAQIWVEGDDLRHIDENGAEQIGVKESDVDDTPVNGATTAPVSSNWAYDHVAATDPHVGYVLESLFDAHTILKADTDNTPAALAVAEQRLVGRITGGNVAALTQGQSETFLTTASNRYRTMTFPIQVSRIIASGKPTQVTQGLFRGFSLPTYAADEEVFSCICVPKIWDAASDITVYIGGWLNTANTDKKFNLQVSWQHWTPGDVVPTTTTDVPVETETGTADQYKSFKIAFTLDYDVNTPNNLAVGDALGIRIRRLDASENEIAGEFVVEGADLVYKINAFGGTTIE